MQSFLDKLPLDILRYEIVPYLDYQTRTALNLSLPLQDRKGYPLQTIPSLIQSIQKWKYFGTSPVMKFEKNNPDPSWTPIGKSIISQHPRERRKSEERIFTFMEMTLEEVRMKRQLREGQNYIHTNIHSGLYERERHSQGPLKCKCCKN